MEGIKIINGEGFYKIRVTKISEDLKKNIRYNLSNICYGKMHVEEHGDLIDYQYTLEDFFERYDSKSKNQKKGIIGELIAHIIIIDCFRDFKPVSVLFNKEEKSAKKGFDLVVFNENNKFIWYTEVKSGECCTDRSKCVYVCDKCNKLTANKNISLLNKAKDDIKERFNDRSKHIWYSALVDLNSTVNINSRQEVKKLITFDSTKHKQKISFSKRVILTSVLFEDKGEYEINSIDDFHGSIVKEKIFDDVIILSIQKDTYKAIEKFLKTEIRG